MEIISYTNYIELNEVKKRKKVKNPIAELKKKNEIAKKRIETAKKRIKVHQGNGDKLAAEQAKLDMKIAQNEILGNNLQITMYDIERKKKAEEEKEKKKK